MSVPMPAATRFSGSVEDPCFEVPLGGCFGVTMSMHSMETAPKRLSSSSGVVLVEELVEDVLEL
jgi:hypothetical protein